MKQYKRLELFFKLFMCYSVMLIMIYTSLDNFKEEFSLLFGCYTLFIFIILQSGVD